MASDLATTIDAIFAQIGKLERSIAHKRRPPLDLGTIARQFQSLDLQVPADLLHLYALCDGTDVEEGDLLGDLWFFPGFYWLSLADAIETYRSLVGFEDWNKSWFPIFANGGGDFYLVICNPGAHDHGSVVWFFVQELQSVAEFESIAAMFQIIERSYLEGAYYRQSDGYLGVDYSRMRAIAKDVQPTFDSYKVE